MKVLVADDSATIRWILQNALRTIGYQDVVEAVDGRDALAKCDGSIDLVITDWNMPEMGGRELVQALRASPLHAQTPILAVTTRTLKEDVLEAVDAGASSYILKPFTPQGLKAKLDGIVGIVAG